MWSCAVTSLRFLGRLILRQYFPSIASSGVDIAYYFSTHGWTLLVSFGGGALLELAAASLRALRSKKDAMIQRFARGLGIEGLNQLKLLLSECSRKYGGDASKKRGRANRASALYTRMSLTTAIFSSFIHMAIPQPNCRFH